VQIRVGLNSGEVLVRAIGSDLHMDYTAVGQTTHLAARMEQMARPGSVLVTGDTLKLAEGYIRVRRLGPITVKGLEKSVEAYELTGVGPARSRLQGSAARGLTRFEESVQTLVETRVLVGDRGAYRMTGVPEAWQIPATAQAMVAARIDRLPPEDKRLLQAASLIGKDLPFTLLRAIADVPDQSLRQGLAHLQAAEFLYERSLLRDLEFRFKHSLTHEVAYASVLHDRQRALHARIMEAIEALYPAHGQEAIRIAEALDQPFSIVVGCLDLAYLKSVRGEFSQAAGLLERAAGLSREWNITSYTPVALASLGHVYAWTGRIEEGASCLQGALADYERTGMGFTTRSVSDTSARRTCSRARSRRPAPVPTAA
jgi:tetratricopeptide (TPR) repeat protein